MEPQKTEHVGGSIDGALKGQHSIQNTALLKESWEKCKGFRLVFFKGFLAISRWICMCTTVKRLNLLTHNHFILC